MNNNNDEDLDAGDEDTKRWPAISHALQHHGRPSCEQEIKVFCLVVLYQGQQICTGYWRGTILCMYAGSRIG